MTKGFIFKTDLGSFKVYYSNESSFTKRLVRRYYNKQKSIKVSWQKHDITHFLDSIHPKLIDKISYDEYFNTNLEKSKRFKKIPSFLTFLLEVLQFNTNKFQTNRKFISFRNLFQDFNELTNKGLDLSNPNFIMYKDHEIAEFAVKNILKNQK